MLSINSIGLREPIHQPACLTLVIEGNVTFKPGDFLFINILADFFSKLFDICVGTVLLELTEHALASPRNTQNILVASRIQIDRHKDILLQSRQLLVVDILADLLMKLRQ